ncbi:zinc dependent phospholipase C family protein [Paenibacillus piri]|nr:zinc dependent phospholipase C family protein [Paenibacillus piri]
MIHFLIADKLFDNQPPPSYLLGSIAPDAVTLRENEPTAKLKSHLFDISHRSTDHLIDFYRQTVRLNKQDQDFKLFVSGYISHIIADISWAKIKKAVSQYDKSLKQILWREEIQMDFQLFRQASQHERLPTEVDKSDLYELEGLYTRSELTKFRKHVFDWLHNPANEPGVALIYITPALVESFVPQAADELKHFFDRLHE